MNLKSWLKNLIYIILLVGAVYLRTYVGGKYTEYLNNTLRVHNGLLAIAMLITVSIGALMGVESFIKEAKKEGKWKINLPKMVLLGLPTLYISLYYVVAYMNIPIFRIRAPFLVFLFSPGNMTIFQILFGYVVITSFYKCQREIQIITK